MRDKQKNEKARRWLNRNVVAMGFTSRFSDMLDRILKRKKEAPVVINVFLDCPTYDRFKDYVAKNGFDESNALVKVLERGMANYWLYWYKQFKRDYRATKKSFKEQKKDNEVLEALEQQNEKLHRILEEKGIKREDAINLPERELKT